MEVADGAALVAVRIKERDQWTNTTASREGDFEALLAMLDPDIVLRAGAAAAQMGADSEVIGRLKVVLG